MSSPDSPLQGESVSDLATSDVVERGESAPAGAARILLDGVTKRYDDTSTPAVDNVTIEIPAGEIVMFVGPSGCGKTTTMKMINRLIEPTSGRILIGDDDVTRRNPDELRRHIGYVIQGGSRALPALHRRRQHRDRAAPAQVGQEADCRAGG